MSVIPLTRLPGWSTRLAEFIQARNLEPFAWGVNDCGTFAFGAIETMTGINIFPTTWDSAVSGMRIIEGAGGYRALIAGLLGNALNNWMMIRHGDVALADLDGRMTFMICTGATLCAPGELVLQHLPINRAETVWRVG